MKFGLQASKELSEFFREKSNIEEQNSKLMSKLAHKASTGTLNSTFAPVWTILRTSAEKLSTLHMQMVQKLSELVKDVAKYADELHKKHKTVKEDEAQTLECVKSIQASTAEVQKARDLYSIKVQELEKLRKDNASQKDIEKLETKLRKLQDDYKVLLDKHNPIKNEFERRMTQTCKVSINGWYEEESVIRFDWHCDFVLFYLWPLAFPRNRRSTFTSNERIPFYIFGAFAK